MKSSTGVHYVALDHVRAIAAFIVVTWHFIHAVKGYPVAFGFTPAFPPFALLDEGHTGVALFMTLSGYLFAKLLDGRSIDYGAFIWNRALRLLPLLLCVLFAVGTIKVLGGQSAYWYARSLLSGFFLPTLPNGRWSITVEFHFYLLLPALIWLFGRSKNWALGVILAAVLLRTAIYAETGEVQSLAYWTIVGRIDQFVLGMIAFQLRFLIRGRHAIALTAFAIISAFYWWFDRSGGFYESPTYPSSSAVWIFLPTLEGVVYATLIAWYDNSFKPSNSAFSRALGRIGEYSYSIYLLHFFFVFSAAKFVNENVMPISNFYFACAWTLVFFLLMLIPAYLSYRFIESPFLRHRKRYVRAAAQPGTSSGAVKAPA